jgi:hypothetical protein
MRLFKGADDEISRVALRLPGVKAAGEGVPRLGEKGVKDEKWE